MNDTYTFCQNCRKEIGFDTPYFTLSKNTERIKKHKKPNWAQAEIIKSDLILELCNDCGKMLDPILSEKIIRELSTQISKN